jgi:signal transduction histidine kinase
MADADQPRPPFLRGGGELADLIARHPWGDTPLGPITQWPGHIRHTVAFMLQSGVPMVALYGEQGTMIYNDAYSVFAAGRHPQLLGSPVREGWPEVADFNDNVMRVGLAGGTLSYKDQELTLYRRGAGEPVWMNLDYSPVLDDDGRPAAVLAIVVETTEKVRAERRLANERARMYQMFDQAPGFMCILRGPGHVFEFANAAYRHLFDRPLIGRAAREAFPELEGQGFFEHLDTVYETGRPYSAEAKPALLARQGGGAVQKYLTFIYQPLVDEAGAVQGVFCEGFDFTGTMQTYLELQRTQAWLQEGLQAAHMVAFEWDLAAGQVRYSPNARQVLGYADGEPAAGLGTVHLDDLPALEAAIEHARKTRGSYHLVLRRFRPDTGAVLWTDTRGQVYAGDEHRAEYMRGVIIDVTERVRTEQALREANLRKDEFLAMLAHELRNPLAPIANGSALLMRSAGNVDAVRRTSELIERQVRHMSELVDDLLDVSRVTRGLIEIERSLVDLQGVVQHALEQARPLLEARQHTVTVETPPGTVVVLGDRTRLVQVLVNLLTNAAKYTPPRGTIVLRLARTATHATMSVEDNGAGIEPALLPNVFDLFTQGERTPDRSQGGLGIGLALVKAIVGLHEGRAWAESQGKGRGSRFAIELPLAPAAQEQAAAPGPGDGAAVPVLRILVTDDNVDAAESLALLLQFEGHDVRVCYSGAQALAAVERFTPQACILDVGLPDMTGLELARRLREHPELQHALFIALTGYGQPHDRAASAAAGFDHHLVKPVEPVALNALLASFSLKGAPA